MVAAHRGHFAKLPENSLAAIREAARLGAEVVEIDVRHTQDDVIVLMHDAEVDRTTDGSGKVEDMTLAEVSELLLDGGTTGDEESSRVPLFSEALARQVEKQKRGWNRRRASIAQQRQKDCFRTVVWMCQKSLGLTQENPWIFREFRSSFGGP